MAAWMQTCTRSQMRSCERGAGNCIEIQSYAHTKIGSCTPFKLQEYRGSAGGKMENSGGRSEIDIDDENDSARTIAASFFYLFSAYLLLLVS